MGVHYFNNSGYADPTAYEAIKNVEEEEKNLRIAYPSGYIDLRLEKFFPCTLERAKKVFRLMDKMSSKADQVKLYKFLVKLEAKFKAQIDSNLGQAKASMKRGDIAAYESNARIAAMQMKRTQRNRELLCQICNLEVEE